MDTPLQCGALLHASGNPSALSLDFHRLHPAHPAWMAMELPWPPWVETALFDPVLLSGFGLLTLEPLGLLTHLPGVTSAFQGSPQLFFFPQLCFWEDWFRLPPPSYPLFNPLAI